MSGPETIPAPDAVRIREVAPAALPMALLLEADPDEEKVRAYLPGARGFVAEQANQPVGVCVLGPVKDGAAELLNIAVSPARQAQGIGAQLLRQVLDAVRASGLRRVFLGTGTFGHQLAFYQRAGFRVVAVERDYFLRHYAQPLYENGIRHCDRLLLEVCWNEPDR